MFWNGLVFIKIYILCFYQTKYESCSVYQTTRIKLQKSLGFLTKYSLTYSSFAFPVIEQTKTYKVQKQTGANNPENYEKVEGIMNVWIESKI